jgi:uncharacterized protein (DUF488 family)
MVLTIGHSTRPIEELIRLLKENGVSRLLDVRTVPRSRYNPQYNADALPEPLAATGIAYRHMPELGGLRKPKQDSVNQGWRNASFRGYADYMQTPEFEAALGTLLSLAEKETVCIMCAEAVPWRCHRSLISDALSVRGVEVRHIMGPGKAGEHKLTLFARVEGLVITYPFALEG